MSFADDLKNTALRLEDKEKEAEERIKMIEKDPSEYSALIVREVEATIRKEAESAAHHKKYSISGYFSKDYESGTSYIRLIQHRHGEGFSNGQYLSVDRANIDYYGPCYIGCNSFQENGPFTKTPNYLMFSQKVVDHICMAVGEKLKDLGFKNYSVEVREEKFVKRYREKQYTFFGREKIEWVEKVLGTAKLLWVEVSW